MRVVQVPHLNLDGITLPVAFVAGVTRNGCQVFPAGRLPLSAGVSGPMPRTRATA